VRRDRLVERGQKSSAATGGISHFSFVRSLSLSVCVEEERTTTATTTTTTTVRRKEDPSKEKDDEKADAPSGQLSLSLSVSSLSLRVPQRAEKRGLFSLRRGGGEKMSNLPPF
jgi:hypothetical protein